MIDKSNPKKPRISSESPKNDQSKNSEVKITRNTKMLKD